MSTLKVYTGTKWIDIAKNGKDAIVDYEYIFSKIPKREELVSDIRPIEIASKLNTLSGVIDYSVIKGALTTEDVVKEIKSLKGNDRLDISNLRNSESLLSAIGKMGKGGKLDMNDMRWHGGGPTLVAGSGITITLNSNGTTTLSASGGAGSPLTTKGDLYTYSTQNARLPVGTNGQILSANSATTTGLEWIVSPDASVTLADVSANSTTTPNSLYTMTSTIPVEFKTSGGTHLLYLDETNARIGVNTNNPLAKLNVVSADNDLVGLFTGASKGVRIQPTASATFVDGVDNTGTGTYQPLAIGGSYLAFTISGTEKGRFDTSGNLGIGTVSPQAKLDIDSGTNNTLFNVTDTTGYLQIQKNGADAYLNMHDSGSLVFRTTTSDTERMTIATGGNVGIGVTPTRILSLKAGSSTALAQAGGTVFDHFVDAGNTGTGEDDLYTDTLAASILATNGDKITATYGGIFAGAALSTQDLRVYFGGTKIYDSGALSIGAATDSWTLYVTCIRVSSSIVRCTVSVSTDFATLFPYSVYTEVTSLTLTNTQVLKITGEAAGAGAVDNQIVAKLGYGEWKSAS